MIKRMKISFAFSSLLVALAVCGRERTNEQPTIALATFDPSAGSGVTAAATGDLEGQPAMFSGADPGSAAPRKFMTTTGGVMLYYPVWLDQHPDMKAAMLVELENVVPEADPRIATSVKGVPAGTTLTILEPGPYYAPYSPTGLAAGEWRGGMNIYVAWRGTSTGKLLPALNHELRHMITQDAHAGH